MLSYFFSFLEDGGGGPVSRSRLTSAALIVAIFFLRVSVGREVRSFDSHVSRLVLRGVIQVDALRLLGCGVGGCGFCAC